MPLYVSLQASGIIMVLAQQATKPPPPPAMWYNGLLSCSWGINCHKLANIGIDYDGPLLIMTVFVPESHSQLNFEKAM